MSPYKQMLDDFRRLIDVLNANAASGIMTNDILVLTGRADSLLRLAERDYETQLKRHEKPEPI